ncbi:protein kinase [Nonomuraea sp. B12E4]|uniref:serine/threonine-protein kinase n=1 Tax=Nonomuraea sp. B12E4 TaxID=3153564 RepID=UPI00325CD88D
MEWSVPGYTEIKQLGAGASGRVVLAVHDETGVEVAIKYLSERLRRDPAALARFRAEARLLTTLRDPNIATLWEYVQDDDGAAIVMELVNGVALRALIREHGATEPEAALAVLKGSLLGLAQAHAHGLVHRDYKPENVIVRNDGVSKLVDFGIAVPQGTTLAHVEGTPPYMAPELWEALPPSPATDVYAATAVFFECLTGHRPYRSTEPSVLGYQHVHAPVPFHDAPEPVRGLIRRGLAKDPVRRPASALEFVEELESTARAAYGEDWEERGRRRLVVLVGLLALLLPSPQTPLPETGTSLARTVFRGLRSGAARVKAFRRLRSNAARVSAAAATVAAVGITVAVLLANRQPPPAEPIGAAAAVPPSEVVTDPAAGPPDTSEPEPTSSEGLPEAGPQDSPEATPQDSPEAAVPGDDPDSPPADDTDPVRPPKATKKADPKTTPTGTEDPADPPTEASTDPPGASTEPPDDPPSPPTSVLGVRVGGLAVDADGDAAATVTLSTSGTAAVTATATWSAPGTDGRVQRVRLSGARSYTRELTWAIGERPCGSTVTLSVTTTPAAPGGARSASVSVPPCPTRVTGLRVRLNLPAAPARTATARVMVTASGTAAIPVEARFAVDGESVATRTATLSGRTSYTRPFTYTFRSRPCGSTLSVTVSAGGRTATARASVPCPPAVRQVRIVRAGPGEGGLYATVSVTTSNTQPVRLIVRFSAGEGSRTETVTLSGRTSYTSSVSGSVKPPCGTRWVVTAATAPAAAGGSDSASGSTSECPKDPEPDPEPEPEQSEKTPRPESPGTIE